MNNYIARHLLTTWIIIGCCQLLCSRLAAVPTSLETTNKKVYALIIGINEYKNSLVNDLRYEAVDAEKMYACILGGAMGRADRSNVVLLTNEAASRKAITRCLDTLFAKAKENDLVLFFFAGHGEKGYFLPHDFLANMPGSYLTYATIKAAFQASKAKTKLLIANACYAGAIRKDPTAVLTGPGKSAAVQPVKPDNAVVFMSCRAEEVSWETSSLQQSVFVYFLIAGLEGQADASQDGAITLEELFYFVRNATYDYVKINLKREQCPVMYGQFDTKMVLAKVSWRTEKRTDETDLADENGLKQ